MKRRRIRHARVLALLVVATTIDCECIDHPLYNVHVNRFDTFYLGGGNSGFRPFREARLDPDAAFEVDMVIAFEPEHAMIRAWLDAGDPHAIRAIARTSDGTRALGELVDVGDDLRELRIARSTLERELDRGDVHVELESEGGGGIVLVVDRKTYEEALAEHMGEAR